MEIIKAYAKVNLFLKVSPPDLNGYHKINSVMSIVEDLYDEIKIISENDIKDEIICNIKTLEQNNFLHTVLDELRKEGLIKKYYKIQLTKNIPLGSGLGGGTSDAVALAKFFTVNKKVLHNIYKKIGYDSYFFDSGFKTAIVKGYGENVEEHKFIEIKKKDLIFTNVNSQTNKVYKKFDELKDWDSENKNQLTNAALKLYPELLKFSHDGQMSGAGSTFIKKESLKKITF
ncbi:4-diphosphocytidyl-2-C-methyl-D-erythritol kinase [Spiroplasma helicoides]|uniref:4-diphosphocytidyl-2-C-methyl-D-erythritol kinase n=1 Tax=Spiroplasma helicoides TaxID=216938 RepID=A0A1B3SME4_9MOLU|nr:hypothetical protein [Spiroplasma helicoides]AOG61087.1 4-diphosphocytidyl-2-C-methyl-D-erythritol kinase [Spiroplasma helicoides]